MEKKYSKLQMQQFLSNGMVHMAYKAKDMYDVVSPYAVKGYESLSGGFTSYVDEMTPYIPYDKPMVMEITGTEFDEAEQRTIVGAIRNHYTARLVKAEHDFKDNAIRMAWFLISFVISSILLFCVGDDTEIVIVQYAYLPFWFFGYRLLIYLILDLLPQLKLKRQCGVIAGMKIVFTADKPINEVPDDKRQSYLDEISANLAGEQGKNLRTLQEQFLMEEDGAAHVVCRIAGRDAAIRSSSVSGYELLTEDLAAYLDQVFPYVPEEAPLVIDVEETQDANLTDRDREAIKRAIGTHLDFHVEGASITVGQLTSQIGWFTGLMIVSSLYLMFGEHRLDKAMLEFATMLLWFFGDYLIEFVLLGYREAKADKRRNERLKQADIRFREE